jgi:hypothetical protein
MAVAAAAAAEAAAAAAMGVDGDPACLAAYEEVATRVGLGLAARAEGRKVTNEV